MKQVICILILLAVMPFSTRVLAQVISRGAASNAVQMRPKVECKIEMPGSSLGAFVPSGEEEEYELIRNVLKNSKYELSIEKRNSTARGTVTIYVNSVKYTEVQLLNGNPNQKVVLTLNNMKGKSVTVKIKNNDSSVELAVIIVRHYFSNSLITASDNSLTMVYNPYSSANATIRPSCSGKSTVEVTKLDGLNQAVRIDIKHSYGPLIRTEILNAGVSGKKFLLDNLEAGRDYRISISNVDNSKAVTVKTAIWNN